MGCDGRGLASSLERRDPPGEGTKTFRSVGSYSQRYIPEGLHRQQGRSNNFKLVMSAYTVQVINRRLLQINTTYKNSFFF